jgi:hypothetical protein
MGQIATAEPTTTRYRVVAQLVSVRTGNSLGLGSGGWMAVQVYRDQLLPADAPAEDIAKLLRKRAVEPLGEISPDVQAAIDQLDAEAEARRPPAPVQSTRDRVSTLLYSAGARNGEFHGELLDALEALIDERVAAALGTEG